MSAFCLERKGISLSQLLLQFDTILKRDPT